MRGVITFGEREMQTSLSFSGSFSSFKFPPSFGFWECFPIEWSSFSKIVPCAVTTLCSSAGTVTTSPMITKRPWVFYFVTVKTILRFICGQWKNHQVNLAMLTDQVKSSVLITDTNEKVTILTFKLDALYLYEGKKELYFVSRQGIRF